MAAGDDRAVAADLDHPPAARAGHVVRDDPRRSGPLARAADQGRADRSAASADDRPERVRARRTAGQHRARRSARRRGGRPGRPRRGLPRRDRGGGRVRRRTDRRDRADPRRPGSRRRARRSSDTRTGAPIVAGPGGGAVLSGRSRRSATVRAVGDPGDGRLTAIATPGHRPDHLVVPDARTGR